MKSRNEALRRVNLRLALLLAGSLVISVGIGLVLLSQGGSGGEGGDQLAGMPSTAVAGILVVVVGLALLVLAILNRAWSMPAQTAQVPIGTLSSQPIQAASSSAAMSSEVEAAVVRLLDANERLMYIRIRDAGGEALQRDIVAWRTFSPAKVSRLLDRLEAKGLIVRERSGSTNRIRLTKHVAVSSK